MVDAIKSVSGRKAGKGGGSSRTPYEAPDNLLTESTAYLIDVVSEGEIEGWADADKPGTCIYFDDTPLQNADGSFNFEGVEYWLRTGTPDQEPVPGFSAVENEVGVGVQVEEQQPVARSITAVDVDAVRIKVGVTALATLNTENGDLTEASVEFVIEMQAGAGGWGQVGAYTINGKTSSGYQRAYRVELPEVRPVSIRVRRITPDTESSNVQDDLYFVSYTEIIDAKLRYPDTAYVALAVPASVFGGRVPRRSYRLKGVKCWVPSNYDPVARTYDEGTIWDGTFKRAFTSNPAFLTYTVLIEDRWGLGERIAPELVDKWRIYQIGKYCDELVPNGLGGMEPRFTMNGVMNTREAAYQVITQLSAAFRGVTYWGAGAVVPVQDAPSDPVKIVTNANVVGGAFNYAGTGLSARKTAVVTSFRHADDHFKVKAGLVFEDHDAIQRYGRRQTDVTLPFETRRGGALRAAKWIVDTNLTSQETVSYQAGFDHAAIRPGDKLLIADKHRIGFRVGGRIMAVANDRLGVTLDSAVSIEAGESYQLLIATDVGEYLTVDVDSDPGDGLTDLGLVSALPANVMPGAVFVLSANDMEPRLFRVMSNTPEKHLFNIMALEDDAEKYNRVELGINVADDAPYFQPTSDMPSSPTGLTLRAFLRPDPGSKSKLRLLASWSPSDNPLVLKYLVRVKEPNGVWRDVGDTTETSLEITPQRDDVGIYQVRVHAANVFGELSPFAATSAENFDVFPRPAAPTGWQGEPGHDSVTLWGNAHPAPDFKAFVIYGAEADDPTLLRLDEITTTRYVRRVFAGGTITRYAVTAINHNGDESFPTDFITVSPAPPGLEELHIEVGQALADAQAAADEALEDADDVATDLLQEVEDRAAADLAEAQARAAAIDAIEAAIVPLFPSVPALPAAAWDDNPTSFATIPPLESRFVTDDPDFGKAYQTPNSNHHIGPAGIIMWDTSKVWRITIAIKATDDGTTGGVNVLAGSSAYTPDGSIIQLNRQSTIFESASPLSVSDGVQRRSFVVTGRDDVPSDFYDESLITWGSGVADGDLVRVHMRVNAANQTDGTARFGLFEVEDITALVDARLQADAAFTSQEAAAQSASAAGTAAATSATQAGLATQANSAAQAAKVVVLEEKAAIVGLRGEVEGLADDAEEAAAAALESETLVLEAQENVEIAEASAVSSQVITARAQRMASVGNLWEGTVADHETDPIADLVGENSDTTLSVVNVSDPLVPSGKMFEINAVSSDTYLVLRQSSSRRLIDFATLPAGELAIEVSFPVSFNAAAISAGASLRTNLFHGGSNFLDAIDETIVPAQTADAVFEYKSTFSGASSGGAIGRIDIEIRLPDIAGCQVRIGDPVLRIVTAQEAAVQAGVSATQAAQAATAADGSARAAASKVTEVQAQIDSNDLASNSDVAAAVNTEQLARVAADSALATNINTVTSTVDGHTAQISQQSTALTDLEQNIGSHVIRVDTSGASAELQVWATTDLETGEALSGVNIGPSLKVNGSAIIDGTLAVTEAMIVDGAVTRRVVAGNIGFTTVTAAGHPAVAQNILGAVELEIDLAPYTFNADVNNVIPDNPLMITLTGAVRASAGGGKGLVNIVPQGKRADNGSWEYMGLTFGEAIRLPAALYDDQFTFSLQIIDYYGDVESSFNNGPYTAYRLAAVMGTTSGYTVTACVIGDMVVRCEQVNR